MIGHPLLLSVWALDLAGAAFLCASAVSALRIAAGWDPASTGGTQLALEHRADRTSVQARTSCLLLLASTLVFLAAFTAVLPGLVPGAMCGTGVLQATRGAGGRALAFRGLALGLLAAWHLLDRLDRSRPETPLALASARALLAACPAVFLAVYETFRAVLRLDLQRPVDCCSMIYGRIRTPGSAAGGLGSVADAYWIGGLLLGGALLLAYGAFCWRASRPPRPLSAGFAVLAACFWAAVSRAALLHILAAHPYGGLKHPCPWCLFLPKNGAVGYPLFGALALVVLEAGAACIASAVAARVPELEANALARVRAAGWRMAAGVLLFLALTGLLRGTLLNSLNS